jgi:hypothetical protein
MGRRKKTPLNNQKTEPALLGPENRLQQISGLALNKIEERIISGEATGAELIFAAKFADPDRFFKQDKTATEIELLQAKREALEAEKSTQSLYEEAIAAMKHYQGGDHDEEL